LAQTVKRVAYALVLLVCLGLFLQIFLVPSQAHPSEAASAAEGRTPMLAAIEPAAIEDVPPPGLADSGDTADARRPAREVRAAPPERTRARRATKIRMIVTAYCPCRRCCGRHSDGKTASGRSVYSNGAEFVAADTRLLPFGTRISIPGYAGGRSVPVLDRGGKIKGRRLDVFFLSHRRARKWGRRTLDVTVYTN